MILKQASAEQLEVIKYFKENNVIVDSVAGSGKTTTILHIATQYTKNILLLTYNKRLKFETRDKAVKLKINNIEVHSYHSFGYKYYDTLCATDSGIIKVINKDVEPKKTYEYDIIIIDEAQDMTPVYFELVHKIIRDNKKNVKLCVLGDRNQSIFKFNDADERYIIYANKLFDINKLPWKTTQLTTTFRLTNQVANFMNDVVFKNNRLNAVKNGEKVRYIVCDCFAGENGLANNKQRTLDEVNYYLKTYKPEDIFVLAPSVKSDRCPVRQLANLLSENKVPIYVPNGDDDRIDDDILKGKVAFCTFHQVKGLERKVVIVYNFDDSYFKYYKKDINQNICPNEIYVALTRASERLSLLHHYKNGFLPFLDTCKLKLHCDLQFDEKIRISKSGKDKSIKDVSVTNLLKHMTPNVLDIAMKFIEVVKINDAKEIINIPIKTKQGELFENVSDITGTAIPAYFELMNKGTCTIYDIIKNNCGSDDNDNSNDVSRFKKYAFGDVDENIAKEYDLDNIDISNIAIDELLYVANRYCTYVSGYNYKIDQVNDYDWLSDENLKKCLERLKLVIPTDAIFEKKLVIKNKPESFDKPVKLSGFIDCIDNNNIYEFKCVKEITTEHFLQLAVYQYMYEASKRKEFATNNADQPLKNILINDVVCYKKDDVETEGIITQIFKNGKVRVNKKNINIDEIIKNKTNEIRNASRKYYIYNILSDEKYEIKASYENLCEMVEYLIVNKYNKTINVSDDHFITKNLNIAKKYEHAN